MSFSGKYTPLALNVLGELTSSLGLAINDTAKSNQGTWTPTGYTQGTVTSSTVLGGLTTTIRAVYSAVVAATTDVTPDTYRSLLLLGNGVCPALGNSRPSTFKPTYPGYGSWTGGTQKNTAYPPKDYPATTHSYIAQTYGDYAWVTGWPGVNAWQKPADTYKAAYLPTLGDPLSDYDEYFSDGFVATVARQAYHEMWTDQFDQYNDIVNSFQMTSSFRHQKNRHVASYINTKTFMSGMYSNMNDLTTSDIAGVTQAFKVWGNDLIKTGRVIYLPEMDKFGLPSVLLKNLQRNNVVTDALKAALHLYSELSVTELNQIFGANYTPTKDQERKIYHAFTLVQGNDLHSTSTGIMYGLNCTTEGIESLADLLDPRKLFPNSYSSLTIPKYSTETDSAKIYDFIYVNKGVNGRIKHWGKHLDSILPEDLAISCGAFSMTMRQIKNIMSMDIQRFSQVVTNLELTDLNLPLINSNPGIPGNIATADRMLTRSALGSGSGNTYRQCDFYGAAAGYPYNVYYSLVTDLITKLTTTALSTIYANIAAVPLTVAGANAAIAALIVQANVEIANISAANTSMCNQLNYYWDLIGTQLAIEQRAIPLSIASPSSILDQSSDDDIAQFVQQVPEYALDNSAGQCAPVLEAISNLATVGGQNLVAMLRESRNASRINLAGGDLQNDVSDTVDTCCASATATLTNGVITGVTITSPSVGYTNSNPPTIYVYPVGLGAVLTPVLAADGSIASVTIDNGGRGYTSAQLEFTAPPQCQPPNPPQQTYADTPVSQLVPPSLVAPASASPTVANAIDSVTTCNCDCWS